MTTADARAPGSGRPLRADAARNHRALVAAAREAFESEGADVALEEVARRAGVGPSTLYRRFAGRDALVAAVFADYFDEEVEPVLARAAADPDPARGVATVLEGVAATVARHRVMLALARDGGAFTPEVAARFIGPVEALLARARAAGVVRDDVEARDLPKLVLMVFAASRAEGADTARSARSARHRDRYLALLLDALAPGGHRRPLPPLDAPEEPV